jgi:hypothetical protein
MSEFMGKEVAGRNWLGRRLNESFKRIRQHPPHVQATCLGTRYQLRSNGINGRSNRLQASNLSLNPSPHNRGGFTPPALAQYVDGLTGFLSQPKVTPLGQFCLFAVHASIGD